MRHSMVFNVGSISTSNSAYGLMWKHLSTFQPESDVSSNGVTPRELNLKKLRQFYLKLHNLHRVSCSEQLATKITSWSLSCRYCTILRFTNHAFWTIYIFAQRLYLCGTAWLILLYLLIAADTFCNLSPEVYLVLQGSRWYMLVVIDVRYHWFPVQSGTKWNHRWYFNHWH